MILDHRLIFSDTQVIGSAGTSVVSTNAFDNGAAQTAPGGFGTIEKDLLKGDLAGMSVLISIIAAASGGTSIEFQLIQATDSALTTSIDVLASTGAIAVANLTAGKRIHLPIPAAGVTKRYVGLRYTSVGTVTLCSCIAALVRNVDTGLAT